MNARTYPTTDDAQAEALKDRKKLADLLDQTVDAMPSDTDPAQYAAVAWALIAQTIASGVRRGLLPVRGHAETLARCRQVLHGLTRTGGLASFQEAAKAALREVVCQI